jgi:hypothetical protein
MKRFAIGFAALWFALGATRVLAVTSAIRYATITGTASALPLTFSGGGALTNATLVVEGFPLSGITGLGTATGTYSPANTGTNLTLNLTAVVVP